MKTSEHIYTDKYFITNMLDLFFFNIHNTNGTIWRNRATCFTCYNMDDLIMIQFYLKLNQD